MAEGSRVMDGVKSAQRVFAILEYFERQRRAVSVSEVARAYGYPVSSVSMLMRTMVQMGYLEYRGGDRTYQPTSRLLFLVEWVGHSLYDSQVLSALVTRLGEETGETILVGMQNGMRLQYVQVVEATGPVRLNVASGDFRDLTQTAMGQVLLARHDDAYIDRFLRRVNAECADPARHLDRALWMARLREVRAQGFATSVDGVVRGGGAVALMLPPRFGATPLAVGVASLSQIVEQREKIFLALIGEAIAYAERLLPLDRIGDRVGEEP